MNSTISTAGQPLIDLTIDGPVATLTLDRPRKLNALSFDTFTELRSYLSVLKSDDAISCVVLAGAGKAFSAGHDLDALRVGDVTEEERLFEAETLDLLEQFPYPVIAKIQGYCLTGALELALACDILVAADNAVFADTHAEWGLTPVWGMSVRLPERVGRARAKELSFTARRLTGAEAAAIGLVEYSVPFESLDATVETVAGRIVGNSRSSNLMFKRLVNGVDHDGDLRQRKLDYERSLPFGAPADSTARLMTTD
ncbi:enoyl-CoA hydratase/isomerase family protein [Nocardia sp. CA-290969]|uniref:enoyl-CoA hydratase/isomerase family protein n=1 Tax=Nocardia sp. CA-290969 TaxID=3239986 RepID=UPI003D900E43